jgi:1-pyrroline-5-carboxylate dehydrogenase
VSGISRAPDTGPAAFNLIRRVSARSIKETIAAPTGYRYPHMG